MTNIGREVCFKLREARREAKLSQSELAQEVGCKQSALSMFENGEPTKLNQDVVEKLAKKFNISLTEENVSEAKNIVAPVVKVPGSAFCPNPACPSNHRYQVEDKVLFLPDREKADPIGGRFCAVCGELLERSCPNCGAPVHAGAVCSLCGERYVLV